MIERMLEKKMTRKDAEVYGFTRFGAVVYDGAVRVSACDGGEGLADEARTLRS